MNFSLQYLQRCSAQTGYPVPPLEKVVRLGEMAGDNVYYQDVLFDLQDYQNNVLFMTQK